MEIVISSILSNELGFPLLTLMLFLPAASGLILLALPERTIGSSQTWSLPKLFALTTAVAAFGMSLYLLADFSPNLSRVRFLPHLSSTTTPWVIQFPEHGTWLPSLGISYFLGIDGLNVWLVPLATGVMTAAIFAACLMVNRRAKAFLMLMLLAETGMLGVFLSFNLFLFYAFWEVMLIPAYFLVGVWGGPRRIYATTKFVVYTVFGSFIMLVAIFYLYATQPGHSLDVPNLIAHPPSSGAQTWLFLAFMLAFAIKAGLFPFHSWAPDAYVEAPIPATVLIASVMGKTATFAILRFALPIFPHAATEFSGLISILAIIGLLYAATVALVQVDIKRTLAFASISHMNIILLGIFALNQQGIDGSILQMINHAVIMAGLFFMVGMVVARSGTRRLDEMSGLAKAFPVMAAFGLLLFLAAMDLPGLGSFAGEFTILIGLFSRNAWFASIAALVTIVAAWYMVRWFQGIFHGPVIETQPQAVAANAASDGSAIDEHAGQPRVGRDLRPVELALLVPLCAVVIWLGVIPKPVTDRTAPTVSQLSSVIARGAR
ncbi:MAG TPA: NADH-quinone oxidoreductase subunit M [Chloroflexota bacterium]|nr:NADH-quinone oxidoreductase subunit M [Chloroflexota bacterium]